MRVILLGNAGAGKSTMARLLIRNRAVPRLSLDEIAWKEGTERQLLDLSILDLREFLRINEDRIHVLRHGLAVLAHGGRAVPSTR